MKHNSTTWCLVAGKHLGKTPGRVHRPAASPSLNVSKRHIASFRNHQLCGVPPPAQPRAQRSKFKRLILKKESSWPSISLSHMSRNWLMTRYLARSHRDHVRKRGGLPVAKLHSFSTRRTIPEVSIQTCTTSLRILTTSLSEPPSFVADISWSPRPEKCSRCQRSRSSG